jgi:hypothetical protein
MPVQIQIRNGTAAQWTSANPTLAAGEVGIETDTKKQKFGDGTTAWNSLGYAGGTGTVTSVGWTGGIVSVGTPTTTPAFTVAGTSGGVPYFSNTNAWASSGALTANALVVGGGAGAAPAPLASTGTATTVLHGNASGAPTFGAVSLSADVTGTLPVANGGTGLTTTPTNGQLDIGNGTGFTRATLTAGTNVTITNTAGAITISATGGGSSGPVLESYQTISSNYSVTAGSNAFSVGPVTVATGVAVTVPTGQVWLIAA